MSRFSEALRRIRFEKHMTQEEFAALLGTTKQNISRYEQGTVSPKISTAQAIADRLGITLAELNGKEEKEALPRNAYSMDQLTGQPVRVFGKAAAGEPIYAPEDYDVYVNSPVKCDAAIEVQGDSMVPDYLDGDMVYIRCCPDVDDGQVAVVFLDDDAVIKEVCHVPDGLLLLSKNKQYKPLRVSVEDYPNLRIFGVPVGFTRMYKNDPLRMVRKGLK